MAVDERGQRAGEWRPARAGGSARRRGSCDLRARLRAPAEKADRLEAATLTVHEREVLLAQQTGERLWQRHRVEVGGHVVGLAYLPPNIGTALAGKLLQNFGVPRAGHAHGERVSRVQDDARRRVLGRPGARQHARQEDPGGHPSPAGSYRAHRPHSMLAIGPFANLHCRHHHPGLPSRGRTAGRRPR